MSWRRALLLAAGVGAALIAAGALIVIARLDGIVQDLIERRASALTGTPVRVDAVAIQLGAGRATLRGLRVANPPGFRGPHALTLGEVEVGLDLRSLLADPLVIDTVRIIEPHVFYEVNAAGRANIDVIRDTVEARRHPADGPPAAATTPEPRRRRRRSDAGGRKLIIHLLELREGQVTIDAAASGGQTRTETLPAFELTAIGVKRGGASPAEAGRLILVAVARDVAVAVAADQLEKAIGTHLGGLLGDLLKKGGSGAIGGGGGLGDVLDGILNQKRGRPTPPVP